MIPTGTELDIRRGRASPQGEDDRRRRLLSELFGPDVPCQLVDDLLRTADVARLFQVSERTVSDWARRGRIPSVQTPGGQRRYPAEALRTLLAHQDPPAPGN